MPETAIFDHYEVMTRDDGSLFELGRGAMGITYKAFDTSLRIPVALKVINATYLNSEIARQRFVREARSAAKLRHRNVATVFHLGTEGDTWFYAMEFIDGETLDGLIKRQGPLAPIVALTITAQVARALNAAAQHELVHRDIKPANLMLVNEDDELVAKVIDFGLAKSSVVGEGEDAATLSIGGFVGTPHFASPEQLEEKEIDTRSDIYSLGVTLWYMLAGQAPFAGSMAQVMSQHLSKPPPYEKLDKLPPAVADILHKMLAKDPADRFQTAADLRKAIEEALDQIGDAPAASAPEAADDHFATLLEDSSARSGMGSFETNTIIASRYRVAESLGETNAGRVFHAYDTTQKREVRLIVLHADALGDTAALTALEREVEKLTVVQHTNLLGVFDFETVDRGSFLVLEWTNGFSLLDLLKARRELEADEALKILAQTAQGVDHALSINLGGLEFGLHQILIHFHHPIEKDKLLRSALGTWPQFEVKLYPLGVTRDIASSQTWAGAQTMVGSAGGADAEGTDARPRYVQTLAAVTYELLGGTLSPLALRSTGGPAMRYTPLSTLSEEGNEVLRRALDPARSFPSAGEFSRALGELDGLQVSRREPKVSPAPAQPSPPPAKPTATPPPVPFIPSEPKKLPIALIGGIAAVLTIGAAVFFFSHQSPTDNPPPSITPGSDSPEVTPPTIADNTPPATPAPATPAPVTPPPEPTRQQKLKAAVTSAEAYEEKGDWDNSLTVWLKVAREYPESPVGKLRLETLMDRLRQRPSPISAQEFHDLRPVITEAAQLDVLSGMMLLADNVRKTEPATAFNWYSAATAKGYPPAMTQLGLMLSNGAGTTAPDMEKAVQCFRSAAEKGDAAGKFALGECYLKGKGVAEDKAQGVELLRESAEAGNVFAMNLLANCYTKGDGVKADYEEAYRLFTKASERGHLDALGNLSVLYMSGQGVARDLKKAAALAEKGARADNPFCMFLYANYLENGTGIGQSILQSQNWYRKAAQAGERRAIEWCRKNNVPLMSP
jgi:serine/threonine protein kinase/TPR repeat protein